MVSLRNSVLVGEAQRAFDADGSPVNPLTAVALQILLDDLAWWSKALEHARASGELPPGAFRMRAARSAASA